MMVLCAIIGVAFLAVWIRSYSVGERYRTAHVDQAGQTSSARGLGISSGFGGAQVMLFNVTTNDSRQLRQFVNPRRFTLGYSSSPEPVYPWMRGSPEDSLLNSLGIQGTYWRGTTDDGMDGFQIVLTLPYWVPFFLSLAYPGFFYVRKVVRRQQEDRLAAGLCPRCGEPIDELSPRCRGCDKPVGVLAEV
jgi:hypothetical protein